MGTVASTLNDKLQIFDKEDLIYLSLISNKNGTPEVTIADPIDYNIGVIASVLEWNRQLTLSLIKQLDMGQAEGKFLDFILHRHVGIVRYDGESDSDYVDRVRVFTIGSKISPAAIIYHNRPYSTAEPQVLEGQIDSAFATYSFAGIYSAFRNVTAGPQFNYWVLPAIARSSSESAFFFVLLLENTASEDIAKVVDLTNRLVAGGISYEIQII